MKVYTTALASICLVSSGSVDIDTGGGSIRGGGRENDEHGRDLEFAKAAVADSRELHSEIGPPEAMEDAIVEDSHKYKYYYPYKTGSCTCARDAYLKVYSEARSHLKMIPLVLPETDGDDSVYTKLEREINRLVDYAVCILHSIDCGCDDGKYDFKIINYYKVSTVQCCCDVKAIRDVIIDGIRKIGTSWELNMHTLTLNSAKVHKKVNYGVYDNIVQSVRKSIEEIGEIYISTDTADKCIDAICADDSVHSPSVDKDTDFTPYICGEEIAEAECIKVCDEDGDTHCVVGKLEVLGLENFPPCPGGQEECEVGRICITAGRVDKRCVPLCENGPFNNGTFISSGELGSIFFPPEN